MTEAVLDASVVLNWFAQTPERGQPEVRALQGEYQAGRLAVVVPSLFFLELLNVAGRRWGWGELALGELADALEDLLFEVAEERAVPLVTDEETILKVAGEIARPPADHQAALGPTS